MNSPVSHDIKEHCIGPPVGWGGKAKALDRLRWVKVEECQGVEQGVVNGKVVWWPGMVYHDHLELMDDIHRSKNCCSSLISFSFSLI